MKTVKDANGDEIQLGESYKDEAMGVTGIVTAVAVHRGGGAAVHLEWMGPTCQVNRMSFDPTLLVPTFPLPPLEEDPEDLSALCADALALISSASDWDEQGRDEWCGDAERWRDRWLKVKGEVES